MTTGYDVGQICGSGHWITQYALTQPEGQQKFCTRCGEPTFIACSQCNAPIRSKMLDSMWFGEIPAPSYCYECGEPHPWTAARLKAARASGEAADEFDDDEAEEFAAAVAEISKDGPGAPVAATKVRKMLNRLSGPTGAAATKVVGDVATAAVKKLLELS